MTTITTRAGKGSPLTNSEMDANLTGLNDDKVEASGDSMTGNLSFGDNNKVILGAGPDLQIYHDGSNSYIEDSGTGALFFKTNYLALQGTNGHQIINAQEGAAVELYHANSRKLLTTTTGVDVSGSVTADGLEVEAATPVIEIDSTTAANLATLQFTTSGTVDSKITHQASTGVMTIDSGRNATWGGKIDFVTDTDTRMRISDNGDISFYEDTGTTAKLFWDASAEKLELSNLKLYSDNVRNEGGILYIGTSGNNATQFYNNDANTLHISGAGNVGIGTSPNASADLHVADTSDARIWLEATSGDTMELYAGTNVSLFNRSNNALNFGTNNTERMRIDASGNFLVGTSTTTAGNEGLVYFNGSSLRVTRDSDEPLNLDRLSTNGDIAVFQKDSSAVGSVGVIHGNNIYIGSKSSGHIGIQFGTGIIYPTDNTGVANDGDVALGDTNQRFSNLYLSGTANVGSEVVLADSGTPKFAIGNSSNDFYIYSNAAGSERMRIDSNGNLLVSKTSNDNSTAGVVLRDTGEGSFVASGQRSGLFNRLSSDGEIINFRKDGTTVGSIGTIYGDLTIGDDDVGIRFDTGTGLIPWDLGANSTGGSATNGTIDLGVSGAAFKDLHLSGVAYIAGTTGRGLKISNATESYTNNVAVLDAQHSQGILQFKTAGSEAARIDKDGQLLLGTTENVFGGADRYGFNFYANGQSNQSIDGTSDAVAQYINRENADGAFTEFYKDRAKVGSLGVANGDLNINGDSGIRFQDTSIMPRRAGSDVDATVDIGLSSHRWKDLYLSGGVYLGGTGSANKLDDYEEGTWTPTFDATTTSPTVAYNTQSAKYTKVGRLVTVTATIITNTRSGGAGHLFISGLPFAVGSGDDYAVTIGFNFNWVSGENPEYAIAQAGQSRILLYKDAKANANSEPDDILASGNSYIRVTATYFT